jgi:GTPase SAR1 family protein
VVYFLARARDKSVTLSKEHDAYIWATRDEALKLITRDETRVVFLKALRKIQEIEKSLANYRHALDRVERIPREVVTAYPNQVA